MMKFIVILCLAVAAVHSSETEFRPRKFIN